MVAAVASEPATDGAFLYTPCDLVASKWIMTCADGVTGTLSHENPVASLTKSL